MSSVLVEASFSNVADVAVGAYAIPNTTPNMTTTIQTHPPIVICMAFLVGGSFLWTERHHFGTGGSFPASFSGPTRARSAGKKYIANI